MSIFFHCFLYIIMYKRCYLFDRKKEPVRNFFIAPSPLFLLSYHTLISACHSSLLLLFLKKIFHGFPPEHRPQLSLNLFQFVMSITWHTVLAVS